MSYIRAKRVQRNSEPYGWSAPVGEDTSPDIDNDLNFEALSFAQSLLGAIEELEEGEALVVWKVVF